MYQDYHSCCQHTRNKGPQEIIHRAATPWVHNLLVRIFEQSGGFGDNVKVDPLHNAVHVRARTPLQLYQETVRVHYELKKHDIVEYVSLIRHQ